MTRLYVFDIDGVLADARHRLHWIKSSTPGYTVKPHWDDFFNACEGDTLIFWTAELLNYLRKDGEILLLTGRPERIREKTNTWLNKHSVLYDYLVMRPDKDHSPDYHIKPQLLEDFLRDKDFKVQFIVEDTEKVVDAYVKQGYNVLECKGYRADE